MLAAVEVHPRLSSLGLPFPWDAQLGGRAILLRTVEAIAAAPSIEGVAVVVPGEEQGFEGLVGALLRQAVLPAGKRLRTLAAEGGEPAARTEIGFLRRLAPSSWRAGWAIPFAVAERGDPRRLLAAARRLGAGELALFPPAAPFVDPRRVEELLRSRDRNRDAIVRLSTLPPGVSGDVVTAALLADAAERRQPLDHLMRFLPDHPERDLDTRGAFHWYSREDARLRHRLTAESRRGLAVLEAILDWKDRRPRQEHDHDWLDALGASAEYGALTAGPVPAEVRLRVTDRTRSRSVFDLPGEGPGAPGVIDPALAGRVAAELGAWHEPRITIAGGEPRLHPQFDRVLRAARAAGAGAVVLETDGLDLDGAALDLIEACADVVIVALDAVSRRTYEALRGADRLDDAERGVEDLLERAAGRGGRPRVAVELREVEENREEAEAFLDRWFPRTPWVVVGGFRDRAGQLARRPLHPYRAAERFPCCRLEETLVVHPDGRAAVCDNDLVLDEPAGDLHRSSVEEVWTGRRLAALRALHGEERWDEVALCAGCSDWCRR
jgi:hypothetical protein